MVGQPTEEQLVPLAKAPVMGEQKAVLLLRDRQRIACFHIQIVAHRFRNGHPSVFQQYGLRAHNEMICLAFGIGKRPSNVKSRSTGLEVKQQLGQMFTPMNFVGKFEMPFRFGLAHVFI